MKENIPMPEVLPLVTVVTVTYNSGHFIRDAIESILCSSYENLELIIGDDCSSDDTWAIVQTFRDKRIRAYRNEKNLGEYTNRNKAFNMAKGEYLLFIDGDDMIYPHGLEYIIKMLEAFPEAAMAIMYPFDERVFLPIVIDPRMYYLNIFFGKGLLGVAFTNTLFRVKALTEIGGISARYNAGDDYTRLRIAALNNTLIISDQHTWWRESPNQASKLLHSKSLRFMSERIEMYKTLLKSENCPLSEEEKKIAHRNTASELNWNILKSLKKFNFNEGYGLLKLTGKFPIPFFNTLTLRKDIRLDPFINYNGANPYKMEFSRNPFSKK